VVGERSKAHQRMGCRDGFVHPDAGLTPFDGQRGGRMLASTAAIRRFSWRKRPLILPILKKLGGWMSTTLARPTGRMTAARIPTERSPT
jgi:hypothetical protein